MTLKYFPVLAYHKISPETEFGLTTIKPEIFETQLQLIKDSGFSALTFMDLLGNTELPDNPIIITFDDGYESIYQYAMPLLKKYGLKAVVYVLSDYIGQINTWEAYKLQRRFRHLSAEQLQELADNGIEIGSHGKSHAYLPILDDTELISELDKSKKDIAQVINREIISFCYPFGVSNRPIQQKVRNCGYRYAVGNLLLTGMTEHRSLQIGRRSVYATDTIRIFKQKLQTPSFSHTSVFTEKVIRLGARAAIFKKILTNNLN